MKIAVFGTGMVGQTLGTKLAALGHEVTMGSRTADNEKAAAWVAKAGGAAAQGTFADAAKGADVIFNCTLGSAALDVLGAAGADNLAGKILVDITNPLDFSKGMPPSLFVFGDDSLAEQIQRAYPDTKVVKALNTINADVMVDPARLGTDHDTFVCGNDAEAKAAVVKILREGFGWSSVIDLGDLSNARGTEAYLLLWVRLWQALGTADFNIKIVKGAG
ncbi:NADPH-dependent F420 reductase [Haliangium sp.]|uniref:NADPH-dependent F420 reductase n=1 Tax=Haliangium sp. TaxID=2663208 RepID=UPI003D096E9E